MVKIGMVIGGRYEIQELIGTGGMSDVYRAKDNKLNRNVAVKVLKQEFSENRDFVAKFRREAEAAANLMHPNIVTVYDVGEDNGISYIVMELVDGYTLKQYIEKKSRLNISECISIAIPIASGIEAAHNNGIIHRDIKPQNVIISKDGKVKVTDFGIAKAATSNTITSNVMGSVHYTSPEQARGGYSDAKSDIYSLGITLFEMLTGRVPFNGDTTVAIAIKHIQEELPSPADYNEDIPISVEKIVLKCCQKSPDRRYQSAAELITDLKRSLITPDEDFVSLQDMDEEGATRVSSQEELDQVHPSSGRFSETEQMRLRSDVRDDYDRDDRYDDDYDRDRKRKSRDYDDDLYDYDRGSSKRRTSSSNQNASGIEKLTIVMAIISAALVGFIVLLLLGRSIGLFESPEEEMSQETSSTQNTSFESATDISTASDTSDKKDNKDNSASGGIQIPDVTGKTYAEAVSILHDDKGFEVKKEADTVNNQPKGTVASTSPKAGDRAKSGDTITVYMSDGSNYSAAAAAATTEVSTAKAEGQVTVPNIIGLSSEDAVITLVEAGLQAGSIIETSNEDTNLTGLICAQSIAAYTSVSEGTTINMELSTGPARVTYSYNAEISAPSEGENYNPGVSVRVSLVTSDGTTLLSTTTTDFPVQGTYKGITAPTGTITFVYSATTPTTTDPETGETSGGETVEYTVTRAVTFTQEN